MKIIYENLLKNSRARILYLVLLLLSLGGIVCYFNVTEDISTISSFHDDAVLCNLDSGFYSDNIEIKLYKDGSLPRKSIILYTTNGDDPKESGNIYSKSIRVSADDGNLNTLVLKAVAYYDGKYSKITYRSFFVGKEIDNRFSCSVISIMTDNNNLYDYEKGIFIPGITYQQYLNDGGDPEKDITLVPCNYNRRGEEWIREAYLEIFEQHGNILVSQAIGLGTAGSSSSGYDIKSLKLVANEIYDQKSSKFKGDIWHNYPEITEHSHNDKFNKIILKSGGQDFRETQVKWDLISMLAEEAGLYPVAGNKKVVVYLNGKYYGLMSMAEDYSAYNIGKQCNLDNNYIEICKGTENSTLNDIKKFFLTNLDDENNRKELEAVVDMDSFMLYYAIQVMINNVDWPQNNYGVWRYTGEIIPDNSYSDGRFRFLLYDVDLAYLPEGHWSQEIFGDEVINLLFNENVSEIFSNVMNCVYYRNKFINVICDLYNTAFDLEHELQIYNDICELMKDEVNDLEISEYNNGEAWIELFKTNWKEKTESVKEAICMRYENIFNVIDSHIGKAERYELRIHETVGGEIICNTIPVSSEVNKIFSGVYYTNNVVMLSVKPQISYSLVCWVVNGKKIYEDTLFIGEDLIDGTQVDVYAIMDKQVIECDLIINEISAKGSWDWIELYNSSENRIALDSFFLTDDKDNLEKYHCPSIYVESGGIVTINGKLNNEMGAYLCNFNLKSGETIYLINKETMEIVDSVTIPDMAEGESYGRYKLSDDFVFYNNPTKGTFNN